MSFVVQIDATSGSTSWDQLIRSITDAEDNETSQSRTTITRIQMIPGMPHGTKDFEEYFVPRVISIGPYHHNKDELKSAEKLKLKFTKAFTRGKLYRMMEVYDKILRNIKTMRDCYDEESTMEYDDEELAGMLFVDGCSLLHYIHCCVKGDLGIIKDICLPSVHQDLFLLENQLPSRVLQWLMNAKYDPSDNGREMIIKFIVNNISIGKAIPTSQGLENASHLLDLLRKVLIGPTNEEDISRNEEAIYNSFFSVTELTAVGIHVKPSDTYCLSDVSFKPRWITGHLKLPPIIINNSTKPNFLNLIAYEMCPNVPTDFEVTSYVCFLASLISHSDDVNMLQAAGTLRNRLGTDEEVAKLFKEISTDFVPNTAVYVSVIREIRNYFSAGKKFKMVITWWVEMNRVHFRRTIIPVLGWLIAISVGGFQAYYTRFPVRNKSST